MMKSGNNLKRPRAFYRLICAASLAVFANCASAQYIWLDANGLKQLSDRPPPASIPARNILKQPGKPMDSVDAPANPAPTLAERDADFRKRAQEKAERDRKEAEQARYQAAQRQHCAMARAYLAQLDSGERIRTQGAGGEPVFMSDPERARQRAQAQAALGACS